MGSLENFEFSEPIIWSPELGAVRIRDLLQGAGVNLSGWTLGLPSDVSDDGRVIAGVGFLDGQRRGWVVTVPAPSTAAVLLGAGFLLRRRRSSRR